MRPTERYCHLLLRAFPREVRDRVGRALVQTWLTDSRTDAGRVSTWRLLRHSPDIVRAGFAERVSTRGRSRSPGAPRRWPIGAELRDVRRSMVRRRGLMAAVFATLAVGLAANTTVFTLVNGILLTDVPYRDPSRLAFMWTKLAWIGVPRAWVAGPHVALLSRETESISDVLPLRTSDEPLVVAGSPELVRAGWTTAPLFDVLGVRALHGRTFVREDEPLARVILGHELWRRRFGGDPGVVGRRIDLAGDQIEVIGVLPPGCDFLIHSSLGAPRAVDLWLPTSWPLATMSDGQFSFAALVRVKPDRTLAGAQAEIDVIGARLDRERFKSRGFGWQLIGVHEDLVKQTRPIMLLVAGGAAAVLLVVCANLAGLLLVAAADRRREFAVRTALGARRGALIRLVVIESVAIAVAAGAAGLAVAWVAVHAIVTGGWAPLPRLAEIAIDWRVAAFTFALATATGLLSAVVPAWRTTGGNFAGTLQQGARGSSARTSRVRALLVATEVALAVVLTASSVLLLRSYRAASAVDPGFSRQGVLTAAVTLDGNRYPQEAQAVAFFRQVLDRVAGLPDVHASGATSSPPLGGDTDQASVVPEGWIAPASGPSALTADIVRITPGYLRAAGMTLVSGRDVSWDDGAGATRVVIVDEGLARTAWGGADPVGRRVTVDSQEARVIGVVRHARQYRVETDDRIQVYVAYTQDVTRGLTLTVQSTGEVEGLTDLVRRAVRDVDVRQPVGRVTTVEQDVRQALLPRRLQLQVLGGFAIGALLLSALGVHGMLSTFVRERRREIGIRVALGADRAAVRGWIVRRVLTSTLGGLAAGTVIALALGRLLDHFLFGVSAHDVTSFAAMVILMAMAMAAAAFGSVRRATSLDPQDALRD